MQHKIDHSVDAQGLICPEPVMMLHNAVRDAKVGEVIQVIATDPSTQRDIAQFCEFLGHELLEQKQEANIYSHLLRKQAQK